jgi:hypothetical protein
LFFRLDPNGHKIYFCIHVDDFAIAATTQDLITELCNVLKLKYTITESDNLESFLGIHIVQEHGSLYLSQPGHIAKIAREANLDLCDKPTYLPMAANFNDEYQDAAAPADRAKYSTLLGMLIYILRTRPDVAYAVNRLATIAAISIIRDYDSLRQIAAYLHTTAHLELVYSHTDKSRASATAKILGYSDAAFLVHSDSKSHSGLAFKLGKDTGVFHARSQKQKTVTLSSTEAEVYAAVECAKDIVFFRAVLAELGFPSSDPSMLFVDNKSAITLGSNYTGNHKKVRHFLSPLNYLIEQVNNQYIILEHLSGTDLPADTLTKVTEVSKKVLGTLISV